MGTADLANILLATGRVQEALVEFRHVKDLDPIGAGTKYIIALITAGQIDLARREQRVSSHLLRGFEHLW